MAGKSGAARATAGRTSRPRAGADTRGGPTRALPGGLPEFDRLIHERLRLGIVSALAGADR